MGGCGGYVDGVDFLCRVFSSLTIAAQSTGPRSRQLQAELLVAEAIVGSSGGGHGGGPTQRSTATIYGTVGVVENEGRIPRHLRWRIRAVHRPCLWIPHLVPSCPRGLSRGLVDRGAATTRIVMPGITGD